MSVSFNSQTSLILVDARPRSGRCYLPLSATLQGRTVTIKDQFGVAGVSSIQIYTNSPDTFEDGTSARWINQGYGFMNITATASNIWTVIGGTTQPAFQASTISTFVTNTQTLSTFTAGISQAAISTLSVGTAYIGTISTANLAAPSPFFSTAQLLDTGTGTYKSLALSSSYIYLNGAAAPIVVPWQHLSTTAGLATAGYVSTFSLNSTIAGLGTATYVSSPSLTSSLAGLGTTGYVSTSWLQSTIDGLGTFGYISTTEDIVRTTSTIAGLGTLGYVSTQQGLITTSSIQTSSIAASLRGVQFLLVGTGSLLSTGVFYSQDGTTGSNATLVPSVISYYDAAVSPNGFLQNTGITEYVLTADLPNRLYVSNNATSWIPVPAAGAPTANAKSIAFGSNAGVPTYMVTTAAAGAASIQYRRTIDQTFNSIVTAGGFSVAGSRAAYNPATDRWVAAGQDATASTLQYTTTLTTWTASAGPTFSTIANSVIWAPGFSRFYAVGKAPLSTATIKMSADGITWSNANTGGFANCNIGALDIAYGNVGGTTPTLVAVGEAAPGGSISTIQWSTDGLNFSNATAGNFVSTNFAAGTAVAYSATLGQWMAAGGVSSVLTSVNGKSWTNASFQRPVGFAAARILAPNAPFYTTLPIIAGPEALFQGGRQIVDTGYLNAFLGTKSFGTSTFSTLTVAQTGTIASLLVNSNGSAAPTSYGLGVDTLTVQTTNAGYTGGIASMAFATATAAYPLARIYAVDSAASGPANSQLVFQTVPLSASSFSSNYSYTGANQTFTVPAGVTTMSVAMWGAGGGGNGGRGGAGAFIQGTLAVTPGQVLTVITGQGGLPGAGGGNTVMFGGGGATFANNTNCGAGGGRSAIQITLTATISTATGSGTTVTYTTNSAHGLVAGQPVIITGITPSGYNGTFAVVNIISSTQFTVTNTTTGTSSGTGTIVAELVTVGGGGGAADYTATGGNATYSGTAASGGIGIGGTAVAATGGSQTAGGTPASGGANQSGAAGIIIKGGNAGYRGGAGGGGYYGGGGGGSDNGGGANYAGGGGGSSWTGYSGFTLISGSNSTDGYTAPGTGTSGYISGVATGGATGGGTGGAGLILLASIGNAYAEAMRIGTTGNVGIGTAVPTTLLDVAGTSRAQTVSTLAFNTSSMNATSMSTATGAVSTLNVNSLTAIGATVNKAGLTTSNTYGTGSDTLTIQTTSGGTSGGVASLYFGTPTYGYPLGRIAALDTGSTYDTSALIFQNATITANSAASGANTFTYTGSAQSYTVPAGVTSITVKMWGAGGANQGGSGGAGAYLTGSLAVTPGQVLSLIVGQAGRNDGISSGTYGGGGSATSGYGSGGGRSAIQATLSVTVTGVVGNGTTATLTTSGAHGLITGEPVLLSGLSGYSGTYAVASVPTPTTFTIASSTSSTLSGQSGTIVAELVDVGGGGGGGSFSGGGNGNATYTGSAAASAGVAGGGGGTQTAGGAAGGGSGTTAGSLLQGGASAGISYARGGGGGGYYGGGGGYADGTGAGGGGGGSSWSGLLTSVSGANSSDGNSPPGTGVPGYISGVARGGAASAAGPGLVIIVVPLAYNLAESMRISNNGYLGIGTSTPGMLLDVAGTARASTITTGIASVSSLALYDNTTPSTGSLYQISSVLYYNNTAIGGVTAANIQAFTF